MLSERNPYGFQYHDYTVRSVIFNSELYNGETISGRDSEHY